MRIFALPEIRPAWTAKYNFIKFRQKVKSHAGWRQPTKSR